MTIQNNLACHEFGKLLDIWIFCNHECKVTKKREQGKRILFFFMPSASKFATFVAKLLKNEGSAKEKHLLFTSELNIIKRLLSCYTGIWVKREVILQRSLCILH
jgi:hypothetical protein